MLFYVAAKYQDRPIARQFAEEVMKAIPGWYCSSTWFFQEPKEHPKDHEVREWGERDLRDIERANLFCLINERFHEATAPEGFTHAKEDSGGRHFETGYALARDIPIYLVGRPTNVFHYGKRVEVFSPGWNIVDLSKKDIWIGQAVNYLKTNLNKVVNNAGR